jgi:hypothetical protein
MNVEELLDVLVLDVEVEELALPPRRSEDAKGLSIERAVGRRS